MSVFQRSFNNIFFKNERIVGHRPHSQEQWGLSRWDWSYWAYSNCCPSSSQVWALWALETLMKKTFKLHESLRVETNSTWVLLEVNMSFNPNEFNATKETCFKNNGASRCSFVEQIRTTSSSTGDCRCPPGSRLHSTCLLFEASSLLFSSVELAAPLQAERTDLLAAEKTERKTNKPDPHSSFSKVDESHPQMSSITQSAVLTWRMHLGSLYLMLTVEPSRPTSTTGNVRSYFCRLQRATEVLLEFCRAAW